jgi:hypothetical protein
VELKLTALLLGGGWLAPLACRTVDGAPQLNSGAFGERGMNLLKLKGNVGKRLRLGHPRRA